MRLSVTYILVSFFITEVELLLNKTYIISSFKELKNVEEKGEPNTI